MSQEPPRVNFPPFSAHTHSGKAKSSAGRVVGIILGVLFLFLFLCSGAAVVTYRKFNADSNFGGSFKELREPIGGVIPEKTRIVAETATAVETDETDEITEWLESGSIGLDKSRFVMEMQRSGLSNGLVNPVSRMMWTLNLNEALEPVEIGDNVAVLDFEWLVNDKEARVTVASFSNYGDDSYVHILYINRQDEEWKLFDWRDVLMPMSEAQYWAIYAGLNEPRDRVYYEFADAAYKIYSNESLAVSEKIGQTMSTYESTRFPKGYTALAQDTLCSWLVLYQAKEELAEVVKQLHHREFAGAWLYKARSAAWSGDTAAAFDFLRELTKQVGWHPQAADMAAEFARTPEQKQMATEWLQRTVLLAPESSSSLHSFFRMADRPRMEALFQQIAKTKQPSERANKLVEVLGELNERQVELLGDIIRPINALEDVQKYLDLKLALAKEDYGRVLDLAPEVLRLKTHSVTAEADAAGANTDFSSARQSLWNNYMFAATESNSLIRAADQAPDRDEFLLQLRDRALQEFYELPAKEAAEILKAIPDDHALREDVKTLIAIALLDVKQGKAAEAFDALLALYKEHESEVTAEEPIDYSYNLIQALGTAALESDRWRELIDILDSEVLLLILAWSDEIKADQLPQVLNWYDEDQRRAPFWPKYFLARQTFENGDWPTADRLIAEAIQLSEKDSRVTEDTLPPLVGMLIDYDEYSEYATTVASSWKNIRLSYATRFDALDRLVSDAQVTDKLDAGWVELIGQEYALASLESQEKIAAMLLASPLSEAQQLGQEIRTSLLVNNGRFAEAFDAELARAQGLQRDSYEQRFALAAAASHLLDSADKRRIEPLQQVALGTEAAALIDCVAATLERDVPKLRVALELWEGKSWHYKDYLDFKVLKHLQGLPNLRELTALRPFDSTVFLYDLDDSTIVLSADSQQAATSFQEFLNSGSIDFEVLETSQFDQATAAFAIKADQGEFILVFKETKPEAFAKNSLTEGFAKAARSLVICVPKEVGATTPEPMRHRSLRATLNELLSGLPSAIALRDVQIWNVFYGEGWQERYSQSLQTGVDRAHPKKTLDFLKNDDSKWFIERDGKNYVVISEARELLPVELQPMASPWLEETAVALAPSIVVPCLPADVVLSIQR